VSKLESGSTVDEPAIAQLTLEGKETAEEWSGHFELVFMVQLWDNRLHSSLSVRNLGSGEDATFWQHALQHTYYATPDVTRVQVQGLKGLKYLDKVAGGAECLEEQEAVTFDRNVDRIYLSRPKDAPLVLTHLGVAPLGKEGSGKYRAELTASCGPQDEATVRCATGNASNACSTLRCHVHRVPWRTLIWSYGIHGSNGALRRLILEMRVRQCTALPCICEVNRLVLIAEFKTFFCAEPGKVAERVLLSAAERWHLTQDVVWSLS